ncbi:MAG: hypothetical protein E7L00_01665 [Propionibacteriaceae bacterium]|nr:hypothetical protein [Propionibacteriaceae bacterium]
MHLNREEPLHRPRSHRKSGGPLGLGEAVTTALGVSEAVFSVLGLEDLGKRFESGLEGRVSWGSCWVITPP